MIQLNHGYRKRFTTEVAGIATAADSTPTAILYRNGSASGVTVTVSTTAETGVYLATFTTLDVGDSWARTDHLELLVTATIDGDAGYKAVLWDSDSDPDAPMRGTDNALLASSYTAPANGDIAAIKAKTDNLPNDPAGVSDVSPTIDFNPTIEPTELSSTSVNEIRDGLATSQDVEEAKDDVIEAIPLPADNAAAVFDTDIAEHTTENTFGWLLTAVGAGVATLLGRITGLLRTKSEADAAHAQVLADIGQSLGPADRRVTFTVQNDSLGVPGARITVDGTLRRGFTDINGQLPLLLAESVNPYTVKVSPPPGFEPVDDISVTVAASDMTVPVELALSEISPPDSPDLIPVLVNVFNQLGKPCRDAKVVVEVVGAPAFAGDAVLTNVDNVAHTLASGQARIDLYRNQTYQFTITYKRYPPITILRKLPQSGLSYVVTQVVG